MYQHYITINLEMVSFLIMSNYKSSWKSFLFLRNITTWWTMTGTAAQYKKKHLNKTYTFCGLKNDFKYFL